MNKGVLVFWGILAFLALFRVYSSSSSKFVDESRCTREVVKGQGMIIKEPLIKESGQVLIIQTSDLRVASTSSSCNLSQSLLPLQIKVATKKYPSFSYGDEVYVKGKLLRPVNFKSENGRIFDYVSYLSKDEIYFEMKSAEVSLIVKDGRDLLHPNDPDSFHISEKIKKIKNGVIYYLFRIKRLFIHSLEKNLGEPQSSLAGGLIVGEKASLGKKILEDFRTVGLTHIIVLSGFNITIIADTMRRLLSFLPRVWGIIIGGIGIALFGALVGGGATVVRSCFMAGIALSADLIRRDYNVLRALILVGLLMIIHNPKILFYDPSFQLSFLATLGLIILAGPIEKKLVFITERFGLRGIVSSTIATQIFVSPFLLHMMGQISLIGMVVNILVLPLVPLTMLMVFMTGILGLISPVLASLPAWFSHFLLSYELLMVNTFSKFPYAVFSIKAFSFWWVVGVYVVFAVIMIWRRYK